MSRKHITTVTLNAAIDKTYFVPSLAAGQANRVRRMIAQPGGKGVNAARVAHLLGEPVVATGFVGGSAGQWIETALTEQGLRHQFVRAGGESRVCLNVVPDDGESVELLEPGLETRPEHYEELLHLLERLADTSSVIVLSGSVPSGGPPDIYRTIIERLKPYGMPVILDTSGAALLHGIAASPHMIKPNQEEMAHLTGSVRSALDEAALAEDVASLVRRGIPVAAVSLGSRGALAGLADAVYRIGAVPIEPVNVVGCGDAFIAGAAVGLHRGLPDEDLFKLAAACGASNALQLSAGVVDPAQVAAFSELVRVERIH